MLSRTPGRSPRETAPDCGFVGATGRGSRSHRPQAYYRRRMTRHFVHRILAVVAAAVLASPAGAQLYKWVDDKGVTNYGSAPPANARNVEKLDESRVSTVPGLKPDVAQGTADRPPQPPVDKPNAQAGAGTDAQSRERCIAERRVDCDDPARAALTEPGGYPQVVSPPGPVPPPPPVPP